MERALIDNRVLVTEITTSANWCMRAGALSGRHLVRFHSRARRAKPASVVEAVLRWARGCKMALRLFGPAAYAWAEGREADVPWWRSPLLMANFDVLYSSCLHVDAGLQRS